MTGVHNAKHIHARILFQLSFWNRGEFDKLSENTFNKATGFPGKDCNIQNEDQRHRKFSNLVLKGKLREAVIFVCAWETGRGLQPNKLVEDQTGFMNKTVTLVLEVKHPHKKIPSCTTLETYEKVPIFIPVDITEDAVKLIKFWGVLALDV